MRNNVNRKVVVFFFPDSCCPFNSSSEFNAENRKQFILLFLSCFNTLDFIDKIDRRRKNKKEKEKERKRKKKKKKKRKREIDLLFKKLNFCTLYNRHETQI